MKSQRFSFWRVIVNFQTFTFLFQKKLQTESGNDIIQVINKNVGEVSLVNKNSLYFSLKKAIHTFRLKSIFCRILVVLVVLILGICSLFYLVISSHYRESSQEHEINGNLAALNLIGNQMEDQILKSETQLEELLDLNVLETLASQEDIFSNPAALDIVQKLKKLADENPLIPEEELALESNLENAAELRNMDKRNTEIEESSMALAPDAEIEETESIHEKGKECPMNVYELLMSQLPQMYPFEDDSVEDCVRMELQDIGRMPMSCWVYGSNSFLLHGYYCYRHLILAKVERRKDKDGIDDMAEHEDIYLMGVPGIWQHREQYMASMFGFRKFKPVSHEKQRSGDFGYWCVELK